MGKMIVRFPDDLIKSLDNAYQKSPELFEKMVDAGRNVIYKNITSNIPSSLKSSDFVNSITKTRIYQTSDGSINAGVTISGYFTNKKGTKTPAPLVANMFEYGSNTRHYPKQPFVRKSLKRKEILEAAKKAEDEYL